MSILSPRKSTNDVFIGFAHADVNIAEKIYERLSAKLQVFFSPKSLVPGDRWDEVIPMHQKESLVTVLLLSKNTGRAYFEREEILQAIEFQRSAVGVRRLIPVVIDASIADSNLPYGLRQIHRIELPDNGNIDLLCENIERVVTIVRKERTRERNRITKLSDEDRKALLSETQPLVTHLLPPLSETILVEPQSTEEQQMRPASEFFEAARVLPSQQKACLIYVDVDGFTILNKKFGKSTGNRILMLIESIIKAVFVNKVAGRWRNDQFIVLLPESDIRNATSLADQLCYQVQHFEWNPISRGLYVTISAGIATRISNESAEEWFIRAMQACKKAKRVHGGNAVQTAERYLPISYSRNLEDYGS